jgi:polyhydroxyalkanoate synthesis regulator phasin
MDEIEQQKEQKMDGLRGEMRELEHEIYELNQTKQTQESAIKRELNAFQINNRHRKTFYELTDTYFAGKRGKVYNEEWSKKYRDQNLLKMCVKYWKYFTFSKGNKAFENKLKQKVHNQVDDELQDRKLVVQALESAIKELEEQKSLEIKKKNIIKSQLDQAYLRGASSTSMQALKMSQGTLNTLYAGVKMPQYNGKNLLAQINLMKDNSKTVTKRVIVQTAERS